MIGLIIFLATAAATLAGYAGSTNGGNQVGDGGYGYGYSGSFSGPGGTGAGQAGQAAGGGQPNPQFDFFNFLNSYFDSLRKYHQQFNDNAISYSFTASDSNSKAWAQSSSSFDGNSLQQGHQNAAAGYGFPGGFPAFAGFSGAGGQAPFGGGFGGSFGGPEGSFSGPAGSEGAAASASLGPGGVHQTAAVYPENPNNPNVNTRFGEAPKGDGFYGVSTSSFSGSSNLDGKPSSFHQASTTVNDNGKVTTYTVRKP